jgi:FMN phosphatase YigB (HAD superfamily)
MPAAIARTERSGHILTKDCDASNCDVISVDVFDTVLLRSHVSERRRFSALACQVAVELHKRGFRVEPALLFRSRAEVQALAYRAIEVDHPDGDVQLEKLLSAQAQLLSLPPWVAEIMHEVELACEQKWLLPNCSLLKNLVALKTEGFRIIAVSDTYYSKLTLQRLFREIVGEHPFEAIYSSSELFATKKSERLFHHVLAAETVPSHRILHIGDDRHADYIMPRRAGLKAFWLPRSSLIMLQRKLDAATWRLLHSESWRVT